MRLTLGRQPEPIAADVVLNHLRTRMPGALGHARLDTPLADLSIDSLDAVELLCLVDEEFDVRLEQGSLEKFVTVGELAEAIAARGASVRHR